MNKFFFALLTLLFLIQEGVTSGSTRVEKVTPNYRVVLETPRKIFDARDGETELDYHRESKSKMEKLLMDYASVFEQILIGLQKKFPLVFADANNKPTQKLSLPILLLHYGQLTISVTALPTEEQKKQMAIDVQEQLNQAQAKKELEELDKFD